MSPKCEICGKRRMKVGRRIKSRSKFNPTEKKFKKPNLHYYKLPSGKKVLLCAKCRKKIKKDSKI
jgi:ribosomal protein L28